MCPSEHFLSCAWRLTREVSTVDTLQKTSNCYRLPGIAGGPPYGLAALLLAQILPVFSVVAPCHRGASPVSVRRQTFVAVGTTFTRRPRHRTVRAELLHTAPALDG